MADQQDTGWSTGFSPPPGTGGGTPERGGGGSSKSIMLRPMTVGDVLDGGFKLFRAHWRAFVLIAVVVTLPVQLLLLLAAPASSDPFAPSTPEAQVGAVGLVGLLWILLLPLEWGALCKLATEAVVGRSIGWTDAFRAAGRRLPSLLMYSVVLVLTLMVIPAVVLLPFLVVAGAAGGIGGAANNLLLGVGGLVTLILLVVAVVLPLALLSAAVPAMMAEGLGAFSSISRSFQLVRPRVLRVSGTVLLVMIVANVINFVFTLTPMVLAGVLTAAGAQALRMIFTALVSTAAYAVTMSYMAIALVLLYTDARIRDEGLDLALAAGGAPASDA